MTAPPQESQLPPCYNEFMPLRQEAEKRAGLIRDAAERKSPREEVCKLFGSFAISESKLIKFLETHQASCGIPPDAVKQMKTNHDRTLKTRRQVCSASASNAAPPAQPGLSDALGVTRVPTPDSISKGRGTWDTLSGNPIR
jgi:hypothetical protein